MKEVYLGFMGLPDHVYLSDTLLQNIRTGRTIDARSGKKKIQAYANGHCYKQILVETIRRAVREHPRFVYSPNDVRYGHHIGYPDYIFTRDGCCYSLRRLKYLSNLPRADTGYVDWSLNDTTQLAHRCIAEAFLPPPDNPWQKHVNHMDLVRNNNSVDNLEWCTQQENITHAQTMGAMKQVVTKALVHEICFRLQTGESQAKIARDHHVDPSLISHIKIGTVHTDVSQHYQLN